METNPVSVAAATQHLCVSCFLFVPNEYYKCWGVEAPLFIFITVAMVTIKHVGTSVHSLAQFVQGAVLTLRAGSGAW